MSGKAPLAQLAKACGLQLRYRSETGQWQAPSEASVRATLAVLGVDADDDASVARTLAAAVPQPDEIAAPPGVACFLPDWLGRERAWGVTCQLYGLRSHRNHGIGDFEDLANLAEIVAADGADFIGVNPVHALFTAAPERCSPFFPSSRQFLNPLYIALDRIPGIDKPPDTDDSERDRLNARPHVEYAGAAMLKMTALRDVWSGLSTRSESWSRDARDRFESFVAAGGENLRRHALFEALSHAQVAAGKGAGWHGWPRALRTADSPAARRFAEENDGEVRFHLWLQWVADEQLAAAKRRAQAAGMRIGLYLDFAVGTAPDGSATWSDPDLVVPGAHIGAPPDAFFEGGQDWGLAPLSPTVLKARDLAPFRDLADRTMRHAGALRIDHAMNVYRLYWIPAGDDAADGCYVLYPLQDMLRVLADVSNDRRTILIGEDLGTVPEGFSEMMQAVNMLSCIVLYFEKEGRHFVPVEDYPETAFASVSTHDLPPLAAWWNGDDIVLSERVGQIDAQGAARRRETRKAERAGLLALIEGSSRRRKAVRRKAAENIAMTPALAGRIHGLLARAPARLLGVQLDDLCGLREPVNVPGTVDEYPNWRRRLPVPIEDLRNGAFYEAIVEAVGNERSRQR